jgi:uncharacterized membrane protein YccF (DUF307 family)
MNQVEFLLREDVVCVIFFHVMLSVFSCFKICSTQSPFGRSICPEKRIGEKTFLGGTHDVISCNIAIFWVLLLFLALCLSLLAIRGALCAVAVRDSEKVLEGLLEIS